MSAAREVVLVSGGGTGIGAATAELLVARGYAVAICGRRASVLEETATRIGAFPVVADLTSGAEAARAVERTVAEFGRLDGVVANAGGHGFADVASTDDEEWRTSLDLNLTTAFTLCRAALPLLRERAGRIVIVSSLAGVAAGPSTAGYTVGKHALIGLTRSLARDYGVDGVRVNAICPGWVRTPMSEEEMDELVAATDLPDRDTAFAEVTRNVPLRRAAEPAEIAGSIAFLLGSDSAYITGSVLMADGGAHMVDVPTLAFDALGE